MNTIEPTPAQLEDFIEWVTGIDMKELLSDDERRVTYFEVNHKIQIAWRRYEETGDKEYFIRAVRAETLLKDMYQKAGEGKSLYLKPSELDSLLS